MQPFWIRLWMSNRNIFIWKEISELMWEISFPYHNRKWWEMGKSSTGCLISWWCLDWSSAGFGTQVYRTQGSLKIRGDQAKPILSSSDLPADETLLLLDQKVGAGGDQQVQGGESRMCGSLDQGSQQPALNQFPDFSMRLFPDFPWL